MHIDFSYIHDIIWQLRSCFFYFSFVDMPIIKNMDLGEVVVMLVECFFEDG